MLRNVASKTPWHFKSHHQITLLSATSVNFPGSQYNLAASEADLHDLVD